MDRPKRRRREAGFYADIQGADLGNAGWDLPCPCLARRRQADACLHVCACVRISVTYRAPARAFPWPSWRSPRHVADGASIYCQVRGVRCSDGARTATGCSLSFSRSLANSLDRSLSRSARACSLSLSLSPSLSLSLPSVSLALSAPFHERSATLHSVCVHSHLRTGAYALRCCVVCATRAAVRMVLRVSVHHKPCAGTRSFRVACVLAMYILANPSAASIHNCLTICSWWTG